MYWLITAIVCAAIGAILGLVPFFLGRYLGKPGWGKMGLIFSAIGGLFGWLVGLIVAIVFTIVCFAAKSDLRTGGSRNANGASQRVSPAPAPASAYGGQQNAPLNVVCISGPLNGQIYRIGANGLTIGRDLDCIIRFDQNAKGISRHHCCIRWDSGNPVLVDLSSSYGTFLSDGRQLMPNNPVPVYEGTVFYLGTTNYMFRISR